MDSRKADSLLMHYPTLYNTIKINRDNLLHSYSAAYDEINRHSVGAYSNPTAGKAVRLAELALTEKTLALVPKFMDTLTPWERQFIITVWRWSAWINWTYIARQMKLTVPEAQAAWTILTEKFVLYASTVRGQPGAVSASGPMSGRRD